MWSLETKKADPAPPKRRKWSCFVTWYNAFSYITKNVDGYPCDPRHVHMPQYSVHYWCIFLFLLMWLICLGLYPAYNLTVFLSAWGPFCVFWSLIYLLYFCDYRMRYSIPPIVICGNPLPTQCYVDTSRFDYSSICVEVRNWKASDPMCCTILNFWFYQCFWFTFRTCKMIRRCK